ncbi:lipoprotein-releasing ABC transporter permease subunit [Rheinheimera sp. MMS21-TC3]|uniref:lipoprotein-releasing ABC transporter permease subunit n=1 Tax=Rheinheimera sp. MMS21-TC3 TaxID=3072790 RepID=UPI0028C38DFE|nr:lipoprotein-releasing ABC transporter permease subunit [Rheinheimera sp. MMS21-TC3]WNO61203.1 lipoprotein-releasing ABC transporter permease subunit [Rheinheimera sp. MMS21-TC3]
MIDITLSSNVGIVLKIRMQLPVSLWIGLRYSKSRKGNAFISFISLFSIAGIFLGVMALTIVSSVMNGFEGDLKKRILGVIPHIIVKTDPNNLAWQDALKANKSVLQLNPFLQAEALVQAPSQLSGAMIQGVTLDALPHFMQQSLIQGSWQQFSSQRYAVVLGRGLAEQLKVSVGEQVRLMLATAGSYTPMGWVPRQRLFTVTGILDTGSDVDSAIVVTALADLQRLISQQQTSAWRITLADPFMAPILAEKLAKNPKLQVSDWRQSHGNLFSAVAMEKGMMSLMLLLIIAVAAFNIVSALVMMVTDKQAEIAILKTLGMTDRQLFNIFAMQGVSNGVFGAVTGALAGLLLSWQLNTILSALGVHITSVAVLPVDIQLQQVVLILLSAVLLTLLAVWYPARKAVRVNPAEILSDE